MKNIFCCIGFENLIKNAGQRGLAALVWHPRQGLGFLLQSRGISFLDEESLIRGDQDIIINISSETGLSYCPFCGTCLKDLADASPKEFITLALEHKMLHNLNFL